MDDALKAHVKELLEKLANVPSDDEEDDGEEGKEEKDGNEDDDDQYETDEDEDEGVDDKVSNGKSVRDVNNNKNEEPMEFT